MFGFLKRWLGRTVTGRPSYRGVRLGLEGLGVPAAFYWAPNPGNPSATLASNWQMAQNGPAAQWDRLLGYRDDLYFQQRATWQNVEYANFDCAFPCGRWPPPATWRRTTRPPPPRGAAAP